ncbi:MAG: hypothetical protein PHD76_00765 [Methylacidiphilales bacterium]|nr:hypothetical protein [Candidatus Methylacidiphilales bacterium]
MKRALFMVVASAFLHISAVQAQTPDFVRLELKSGTVIYGHLIERADKRIHVAGASVNTWVPLRDLSDKTLHQLGLSTDDVTVENGTMGLDQTRVKLAQSESQYQNSNAYSSVVYTFPDTLCFFPIGCGRVPHSHFGSICGSHH